MTTDLRALILDADDIATRAVDLSDIPGWPDTLTVAALSGKERDAYEASLVQVRGTQAVPTLLNMRAKLVARGVIDPDTRERIFTDADINQLGTKSAAALDRLYDAVMELSGMDRSAVEELAGNSAAAPSGDSSSS